jgi:hypothetical protein
LDRLGRVDFHLMYDYATSEHWNPGRGGRKKDSGNTNKKFWAEQWVHKLIERAIVVLEKMERAYPG